jgi:YVTN family beta-propeller protein
VLALLTRHEASLMRVARQWSICQDDAYDALQRGLEIYVRRIATIDPATERVVKTIRVDARPVDGVPGPDGLIWVPSLVASTVTRIDPATNSVVDKFKVGRAPFVLTVGFGDVWAPSYGGTQLWRLRVR